jgi:class 3 adenylate cyclase
MDPLSFALELDELTAEAETPQALALSVVSKLCAELQAGLVLLFKPAAAGNTPTIHATCDREQLLHGLNSEWLAVLPTTGTGVIQLNDKTFQSAVINDRTGNRLAVLRYHPFSTTEIKLLRLASNHLEQNAHINELTRSAKQEALTLRTVLKIDRIRDNSESLDELLNLTLAEICNVLPNAASFIMLFNIDGNQLELRAVSDQYIFSDPEAYRQLRRAAEQAIQSGENLNQTYAQGSLRALIGIPLILNDHIEGFLGAVNTQGRLSFSDSEQKLLAAVASQIDTAIYERLQSQRLRDVFGRHVSPKIMDQLVRSKDLDLLKGERVEVTTMFTDMRGFTSLSQTLPPETMEQMINDHLAILVDSILSEEGMINKFLGDGAMALFNVPTPQTDHALRAVRAAVALQTAHNQLMQKWQAQGLAPVPIGIGITTGEAVVGNFGSPQHAEYTAIGVSVNLAARFCASSGSGQIWIDETTWQHIKDFIPARKMPALFLKGFPEPISFWMISES